MMLYLDQVQSVGPDSPLAERRSGGGRREGGGLCGRGFGGRGFARRAFRERPEPAAQKRTLGLNENLAREILELHTVGVNGGYTQADVTEFARAMTGLSIGGFRGQEAEIGHAIRLLCRPCA